MKISRPWTAWRVTAWPQRGPIDDTATSSGSTPVTSAIAALTSSSVMSSSSVIAGVWTSAPPPSSTTWTSTSGTPSASTAARSSSAVNATPASSTVNDEPPVNSMEKLSWRISTASTLRATTPRDTHSHVRERPMKSMSARPLTSRCRRVVSGLTSVVTRAS